MDQNFALIIAIENYNDTRINPVQFAGNDASAFSKAIQDLGVVPSNKTMLIDKDATKTTIESRLRSVLGMATKNDKVYIYYAGHGFAENDHNYITCSDTLMNDLINTSISISNFLAEIKKSTCEQVILFLDSCHSGLQITDSMRSMLTEMSDKEFKDFFSDSKFHVAFASCQTDQYSYSSAKIKHGVWTYHVLKALRGEESTALERGKFLTSQSLQSYLSVEIPRSLRNLFSDNRVANPSPFW